MTSINQSDSTELELFDFAIVIVNWNGGDLLLQCIDSVLANTGDLKVEVIVVDNQSSDGSDRKAEANYPDAKMIRSGGNLGFGKACNIGILESNSKLVMFLNPDALIMPDTLEKIWFHFENNVAVGGIGTMVKDLDGNIFELGVQRDPIPVLEFQKLFHRPDPLRVEGTALMPRKDPLKSGSVTKLYGACLIVRRDVLEKIGGGFDDRFFMYCEDVDICRRILAAGYELYYLAEAIVVHNQGSCSVKAPSGFSVLMQCDSLEKYMRKYHGQIGAFIYRVLLAIGSIFRLIPITAIVLFASSSNKNKWKNKQLRNWTMFQWACHFKRAFVPQ